jgi:AraC-like DNA-binding protein
MKLLFICLFLIFSQATFSQNNEKALDKMSYDELWLMYFDNYKKNPNQIIYAEKYLNKAKAEKNNLEIGRGLYLFAFTNYEKNDNVANSYLEKSLYFAKNSKDNNLITTIYFDRAGLLKKQLNFKEAIENFILANKYCVNEDYKYIIKLNIAVIKSENLGEIDEALLLYKKCYKYYIDKGIRKPKYSSFYQEVLFDIADAYKAKKMTDSATFFNKLGYIEAKFCEDEEMLNLFILNEGANLVDKKDYINALDSIKKAIPIMKKYKNSGNLLASYYYLGTIYENTKDIQKAVINYKKVDSIYKISNSILPEFIGGYKFLISFYKETNDKTNELIYLKKLIRIDSTLQMNYKETYKIIQKDYEIPQLIKEKETLISSLKNNNATKKYTIIGLMILACVLVYFGIYQFKQRKKDKHNFELLLQKSSKEPDFNIIPTEENANTLKKLEIAPTVIENILVQLKKFEKEKGFLQNTITINTLAQEFETNTNYLSQIINHYKETSFTTYLNNLRIDFAVEELKKNKKWQKYAISSIATEVGFNTSESFSSAFFKKTSIKPSYFIKELQKIKD